MHHPPIPSRPWLSNWVYSHRRILLLKAAVAVALVGAHLYPNSQFGLIVNLVWLLAF